MGCVRLLAHVSIIFRRNRLGVNPFYLLTHLTAVAWILQQTQTDARVLSLSLFRSCAFYSDCVSTHWSLDNRIWFVSTQGSAYARALAQEVRQGGSNADNQLLNCVIKLRSTRPAADTRARADKQWNEWAGRPVGCEAPIKALQVDNLPPAARFVSTVSTSGPFSCQPNEFRITNWFQRCPAVNLTRGEENHRVQRECPFQIKRKRTLLWKPSNL